MGDIWPYEPPTYTSWDNAAYVMEKRGISRGNAAIFAAIGEAESSLDLAVINDTPATGDYSVGVWQINYYNGLYSSRVAQFGTPKQLILNGLQGQADAAIVLWRQSGFTPWSTFNNGAYKQYLHGAPPAPTSYGGVPEQLPTVTASDSWAGAVRAASTEAHRAADTLHNSANYIRHLTKIGKP